MDEHTIELLQTLAPDLMGQMIERMIVLERISMLQPVGRRALAQRLQMQEREIRTLSEALRQDGYIRVTAGGMSLTEKAHPMLEQIRDVIRNALGLTALEYQLAHALGIERIAVVAGNADEDETVLQEVGRQTAQRVRSMLREDMILAVTGGTTVAAVARNMPCGNPMDVQVLPARGGVGRTVELQASTLAAEFARKLGGHHHLLHVPDALGSDALKELLKLPEIGEPLRLLKKTDLLLYGIGRADDMARNRRLSEQQQRRIREKGALAEALGYYFGEGGVLIEHASNVGIDVSQLENIPTIVAVAAGERKAQAILAVLQHHRHDLVVLDEGAARAIIRLLGR